MILVLYLFVDFGVFQTGTYRITLKKGSKKVTYIITVFALLALTACENDLNTLPLNDYDQTSEVAYNNADSYLKGLAYINAYYNFVSQNDPGQSDLSFSDAGLK